MDPQTRSDAASRLLTAYRTREPIDPLTSTYEDMTVEDSYAIQLLQIDELLAAGRTVQGHKVGLTSVAMQKLLGVNEPDYGHLLDDFFYLEHMPIPTDRFLQPRVEPETSSSRRLSWSTAASGTGRSGSWTPLPTMPAPVPSSSAPPRPT